MTEEPQQPRPFRRRLVINTIATGAGNGWAMVVSFVTLPVLARGLGLTAFGLWVVLQTFSAITGWFSLADLGVGAAATRRVASQAAVEAFDGVATAITTAMALFIALGAAWSAVFALAAPVVLPSAFHAPRGLVGDFRLATLLFAVQLFADLVTEGAEACLEGLQRVDLSRAVDSARRTMVATGICVAAVASRSLVGVAAASLLASCCGTAVALLVLGARVPKHHRRPRRAEALALLRYGRTVALLRPLGVVQRTMDRLIVGIILGPAAIAVVEVATQALNGTDAVLSATSYAVFPGASWLEARQDRSKLRHLFVVGTKYSALATCCTCALLIGVAGPLVRVWVGPKFALAPELIVVAVVGEMIAAPCQVASQMLLGVGRAADILRAAFLALLVNLVTSVLLVETVGTVGTFIGTLVANIVLVPTLLGPVFKLVDIRPSEFVRRSLLPDIPPVVAIVVGALIGAAIPRAPAGRLVSGLIFGVVAGLLVAAVTTLNKPERRELRGALRWRGPG